MPLVVKPISANLTRDTDNFATMDPYAKIYVGQENKRTKVHQNGGCNPMWNDTLQFMSTDSLLRVQLWDQDVTNDDLIGEGSLNLAQVYSQPNRADNQYVDLTFQGYAAGRILLSVTFQGQFNYGTPPIVGGFGQPGYVQPPNPGWGQPPPAQGWGQPPAQGWGQPPPAQGWGQPPPNQWGPPPQNQGWGQPPPNQGWGQQPPPNQGWGQPPNPGWGQPPNQGW